MGCQPSKDDGASEGSPDFKIQLELAVAESDEASARNAVATAWEDELRSVLSAHPLSPESVATHKTPADLWIVVDGFAIDCTRWQHEHPAGAMSIRRLAGEDASADFNRIHSATAKQLVKKFRVGRVVTAAHFLGSGPSASNGSSSAPDVAGPSVGGDGKPTPNDDAEGTHAFVLLTKEMVSHNTARLCFATPDRLPLTPGGHMAVMVPESNHSRPYTPFLIEDTTFTMLVKKYDHGRASGYLHSVEPGTTVRMRGPIEPYATLPASAGSVLLVAGGTGISPIYSLAATAFAEQRAREIVIVGCFRTDRELLLHDELRALVRRSSASSIAVRYYPVLSQNTTEVTDEGVTRCFTGRLSAGALSQLQPAPGAETSMAIVCGPSSFNFTVEQLLLRAGVEASRLCLL